jgi:uridine phosphorylase
MVESPAKKPKRTPLFNSEFMAYPVDNLYHFGLSTSQPLRDIFKDVEYVCMMGSEDRNRAFASKLPSLFPDAPAESATKNLASAGRGNLFKVGKVMCLSHGMGNPSCLIFLHEVAKLCYWAGLDFDKLVFIRLGTCGGVGVPAGSVVVTDQALDGELQPGYDHVACGVKKRWPAQAEPDLNKAIVEASADIGFLVTVGNTMSTDDYYEGQGRLDGALQSWYGEEDKMALLKKAEGLGVKNIEMEATCFFFFFNRLGARAAIIGGALLDRLGGDQHSHTPQEIKAYSARPQEVCMKWLEKDLGL